MRKLLAMVITAALALSMAAPALAEDNDKTRDVNLSISNTYEYVHKLSLDITWGSLEFVYTENVEKVWNPKTKQYDVNEESKSAGWNKAYADINVVNRSDVGVTVTATYNGNYGTLETADEDRTLKAASEGSAGGNTQYMFVPASNSQMTSELIEALKNTGDMGSITITIEGDTTPTTSSY